MSYYDISNQKMMSVEQQQQKEQKRSLLIVEELNAKPDLLGRLSRISREWAEIIEYNPKTELYQIPRRHFFNRNTKLHIDNTRFLSSFKCCIVGEAHGFHFGNTRSDDSGIYRCFTCADCSCDLFYAAKNYEHRRFNMQLEFFVDHFEEHHMDDTMINLRKSYNDSNHHLS